MITITIPAGFVQERTYALHVLCYEFLGIPYSIVTDPSARDYALRCNDSEIRIADAFFGLYDSRHSYLTLSAIPERTFQTTDKRLDGIHCLYGNDLLTQTGHVLYCGVDLIAGTFFLLTRWEENVNPVRDHHGRFPAKASVAVRDHFLHRPVVNEYADLLKKWLIRAGVPEMAFRKREFHCALHCDVDTAKYYVSPFTIVRKLAFRCFRERSFSGLRTEWKGYQAFRKTGKDPYDTYDRLMTLAESAGSKATFYFLTGYNHAFDEDQTLDNSHVLQHWKQIRQRSHHCGIHFSYLAADSASLMAAEMKNYNQHTGEQAKLTRQHYLRCSIPDTWKNWEEVRILSDSTMGYPEEAGFRCGTCYPFPLFDIQARRILHVMERPLIAMDVTFKMYVRCSPQEALETCKALFETVKKHKGEFVLLWHNSSFAMEWIGWEIVPETLVQMIGKP